MITTEHPEVKIGFLTAPAWVQALADEFPNNADELLTLEWQSAGVLSVEKNVDTEWAKAIKAVRESKIASEIVSVHNGVAFSATVVLDHSADVAACITARGTFDDDHALTAAHPMLEIAIAPVKLVWLLIRRVLPPIDALRAAPRQALQGEVERIDLDDIEIPEDLRPGVRGFGDHLASLPDLPDAVRDVLNPTASVFAYTVNAESEPPETTSHAWGLGEDGIYWIDTEAERTYRVPEGDLGYRIVTVFE